MAAKLTPEQRSAQRSLNGCINGQYTSLSKADGLRIWRPGREEAFDWYPGVRIEVITADLDTLEVPYTVAATRRGPTKTTAHEPGFVAIVAWDDLPALQKWIPTRLGRLINAVERHDEPQAAGSAVHDR